MQLPLAPSSGLVSITPETASNPEGYKRLYGFHKYWGKKPREPIGFLIESLTDEGDVVVDPFVGFGTTARESIVRKRRFIGFDVNPIAIELTRFLVSPPSYKNVYEAFQFVKKTVKDEINSSYRLTDSRIASHYLWENDKLAQVWLRGGAGRTREVLTPSPEDHALIKEYAAYESSRIRSLRFFSNSRINTHPKLSISSILTGRAQRNIDLLISCFDELPSVIRSTMNLCLTSASGQMTKMVFAIKNRAKARQQQSSNIEVGSWVIGYWRPTVHFEVNVWNCFERRVSKLLNSIKGGDILQGSQTGDSMENFLRGDSSCYIACKPCQDGIGSIQGNSTKLIIMDPPHGDRIPYLELSELWNSILGADVDFASEIVISNAKERGKTLKDYNHAMKKVISRASQIMQENAYLALLYNARRDTHWTFVSQIMKGSNELEYLGKFPCNYSASSVVQDNRRGGLKDDLILVFGKSKVDSSKIQRLAAISNWSTDEPRR